MTAAVNVLLICDEPHCDARWRVATGDVLSARAQAGLRGWLWSSSRGDFCPAHTGPLLAARTATGPSDA